MMGDHKASDDVTLSSEAPRVNPSSSDKGIAIDSPFSDLLNLEDGDSSNPYLVDVPSSNKSKDHDSDHPESPFFDQLETPKIYVAPRVAISHQDSFSIDSRIHQIEDARISIGSPQHHATQDPPLLPHLRVIGSPRALIYPRALVSPRFGSPRGAESPLSSSTPRIPVGAIDMNAPFDSVREEVSKFGGITDWKAHKIQNIERRKLVDEELEKMQEEIPAYKKQAKLAEKAREQVQEALEGTQTQIEELKLEVEKAQKEEEQARQDSELVKLRVEEIEQGIAEEASVAAKAQLEVAQARQLSAVSELKSVRGEIENVSEEYKAMLKEKELAAKRAEEAIMEAKEMESKMDGLTIELMATKEILEATHTAHLEAEEKRFSAAMARDHDIYNWEKELKMVEEDVERLNQEIQAADDVKIKLDTASSLLRELKSELEAYMENSDIKDDESNNDPLKRTENGNDIQRAIDSANKELEEVKSNIVKATSDAKTLKITAASLESKLERERKDLEESKQREQELEQIKDKELREEIAELNKKLEEAAKEADEAKSLAEAAGEELRKAENESDQAKKGVRTVENRLIEARKEVDAARASEKLALAAIKALQDSEIEPRSEEINTPRSIIISMEEYYELSKRAQEAEEEANAKLEEIVSQIEMAKEEESRILDKLEEVNREMAARTKDLAVAMEKAEKAREGKLGVEQELRKWRSEHGMRKKDDAELHKSPRSLNQHSSCESINGSHEGSYYGSSETLASNNLSPETKKKKKKFSLLPKVFMFLSRKKSHSHK